MVKPVKTLLLLALTFAAAVSLRNEYLYFLLGFETMALLGAWLQCRYLAGRIAIQAELPQPSAFQGEHFEIWARLTNTGVFSAAQLSARLALRWFPEEEAMLVSGKLSLAGREQGRLCFAMDTAHCGSLEIWADKLTVTDSLGIFQRRCPVDNTKRQYFYVLPKVEKSENAGSRETAAVLPDGEETRSGTAEPDNSEFRVYRPGDAMKLVHWKQYARVGELMVRESAEPVGKLLWLYLHLGEKKGSRVQSDPAAWDGFIKKTAEISSAFLLAEMPHAVMWLDGERNAMVQFTVADGDSQTAMLCGLLRTRTFPDGDVSGLLREIRLDETKGTCYKIDLSGNFTRTEE